MRRDILTFLFILAALFFNWPILGIFGGSVAFSLFVIWLVFIILIFITTTYRDKEDGG